MTTVEHADEPKEDRDSYQPSATSTAPSDRALPTDHLLPSDLAPDEHLRQVSLQAHKASRQRSAPLPFMSDAYLPHAEAWTRDLYRQELLPLRPPWLDAMKPLCSESEADDEEEHRGGAAHTAEQHSLRSPTSGSSASSASSPSWSRSPFSSPRGPRPHFYLRKLQSLLCHCAQRPSAQPLADYLLRHFPEHHAGRLSVELLCLPLTGKMSAAVSLLVKSSSVEIVLAFSEYFFAERLEWNILLDYCLKLMRMVVDTTQRKRLKELYGAVLQRLADLFPPDVFLGFLPPNGDLHFFLPFIESCILSHQKTILERHMQQQFV
mmetsp:Transcript_44414/g.111915  ORF Transcript_44414/g.111915 Transcript_44414/m.111915 type:complete len:321 (-) Transcript_44414:10-972(-)